METASDPGYFTSPTSCDGIDWVAFMAHLERHYNRAMVASRAGPLLVAGVPVVLKWGVSVRRFTSDSVASFTDAVNTIAEAFVRLDASVTLIDDTTTVVDPSMAFCYHFLRCTPMIIAEAAGYTHHDACGCVTRFPYPRNREQFLALLRWNARRAYFALSPRLPEATKYFVSKAQEYINQCAGVYVGPGGTITVDSG
jgi:hypothetical protein